MVTIYIFETRIAKSGRRLVIYPPREYQEKLRKLHGERVKVIVVKESE
jgi:hypothetical protein